MEPRSRPAAPLSTTEPKPIPESGAEPDALPIHLVDLGKATPKAVKALRRGGGKLHQAVIEALEEIEFKLGDEATGKTILPVVVVVEKKRKRRSTFPLQLF